MKNTKVKAIMIKSKDILIQRICNYKLQKEKNNNKMSSRSDIKYEIARNDQDDQNTIDYYLHHSQDYQTTKKIEKSIFYTLSKSLIIILIYFILSVGLTFYNQWLYNDYNFKYPLTVSTCHLLVKFILSSLIRNLRKCREGHQQKRVPWYSILSVLAPPGIASGFDIGLSNWAQSLITLSLYTMTKSTTIIFILGFSLIFKLEKKSWSLGSVVILISCGLLMFTYKSTQFQTFGFILCLFASFTSGIRWTMTQLIMTKTKLGLNNPVDMMYHMQPWMLFAIIPIALWFEADVVYNLFNTVDTNKLDGPIKTTTAVLFGAIIAFNMEIMEYLVISNTSSLTLSISGIVKEICTLILAHIYRGDIMTGINFVGLLMCLSGIIVHIIQKIIFTKKKLNENLELHSNSITSNGTITDYSIETNVPLLNDQSTSLKNLLASNFSSDDDDNDNDDSDDKDNTSNVLFNILQRREQS
ncbi:hypothetical protein HCN44_003522 [Aphidius gifuensis]|uniref:Sugar phosphate transporter domain-containing protein n=1 Tax=Aphidius gifuensis TaxID=684658 RepID=A0A835CKC1_APHGI|nr:hypothetical protein HCN44_003522 [Aphidius gifuensis]